MNGNKLFCAILCFTQLLVMEIVGDDGTKSMNELGHLCDRTKCSDKNVLIYNNIMPINLISKQYTIKVAVGQEWTVMTMLKKQARWIVCAGKVDVPWIADHDSTMQTKNLPIDSAEAKKMAKEGKCSISQVCDCESCFGADSSICGNVDGNNDMLLRGYTINMDCKNRNTFRTGCNQDFMCGSGKTKVRVFIKKNKGNLVPESFSYIIKKPGVDQSEDLNNDVVFQNGDGTTSFVEKATEPVTIHDVKAYCYSDEVDTICRVESDAEVSPGETIRFGTVQTNKVYSKANKMYFLNAVVDKVPNSFKDYSSSSVKDLLSLFNIVEYVNLQTEKNLMVLHNRIDYMSSALIDIIKSLGKIDDSVIGQITKKPSKTIWLTPDVFQQCACSPTSSWDWESIKNGTNPCDMKTIPFQYIDGGYVKTTGNSAFMQKWISDNKDFSCSINSANTHGITFKWEDTDYRYDHIFVPEITGSSTDWDGWTSVVDNDNKWNNEDSQNHPGKSGGGEGGNVTNMFGLWYYFNLYLPWIALFFSLISFFKVM